jgi:hypothetical protein
MKLATAFAGGLIALLLALPAGAENRLACPELATAQRVGTCPNQTELQHYWEETCVRQQQESNNPNVPECARKETFIEFKDKALWEARSGDHAFQGYLACGEKGGKIKESGFFDVALECSSKACKIYCGYENGFSMYSRVEGKCRLPGKDKPTVGIAKVPCGKDGTDCAVTCE